MTTKALSYKSVVNEETNPFPSNEQSDVVLNFCDWDTVMQQINACQKTIIQPCTDTNNTKSVFLQDFSDFITNLTINIKDYYGFHGLGNELTVSNITDCFDSSITIDVFDNNSANEFSSDDDDAIS
jgi:hypothetical protein